MTQPNQNPVTQGPKTMVEGFSGNIADVDSSGNLKVTVVSGGGSNASVGTTGSAVPASATLVGGSESGTLQPVSLDGSGNLKVSATSLPLPAGAATDATLTNGNQITQSQSFGWTRSSVAQWTSATPQGTTVTLLNNVWSYNTLLTQIETSGTATDWAIAFQYSLDGVLWDNIPLIYQGLPAVNPVVSQSQRIGNISGYPFVRASLSSAITGSGTVTVNAGFQSMGEIPQGAFPALVIPGSAPVIGGAISLAGLDTDGFAQVVGVSTGSGSGGTTNPLQIDLSSINSTAVVSAANGVQQVGISGATGVTLDASSGAATSPTRGLLTLSENVTTAPSLSTGQSVAIQSDYQGSVFVKPYRRGQTKGQATTITNSSASKTVVTAQASGIFADISTLVLTVTPAATTDLAFTASLSDGTNTYVFDMDTGALATATADPTNISVSFDPPLPATTAATAWTLTLSSSSVTVHVTIVFVLQKDS